MEMTLEKLHAYIQTFQIEAILDISRMEIRTPNFVIRKMESGQWWVTEKNVNISRAKMTIVGREIAEKMNL